jgi:hypothetical protein
VAKLLLLLLLLLKLLLLLPLPLLLLLLSQPLLLLLQSNQLYKLDKKADASRLFYFRVSLLSDDFNPIQSQLLCRNCYLIRFAAQYLAERFPDQLGRVVFAA